MDCAGRDLAFGAFWSATRDDPHTVCAISPCAFPPVWPTILTRPEPMSRIRVREMVQTSNRKRTGRLGAHARIWSAARSQRRRSSNLAPFAAGATLAMLLAMTVATAITVRGVMLAQSREQFNDFVSQAAVEINAEVSRGMTELAAVEGFIRETAEIDGTAFARFTETVSKHGTAVQALGYIPRIPQADAGEFSARLAREGRPDYDVRSAGSVPDYFPLVALVSSAARNRTTGAEQKWATGSAIGAEGWPVSAMRLGFGRRAAGR